MSHMKERLIEEAEAYARDGMPLPLDLISSLMAYGIDHTLYSNEHTSPTGEETTEEDIHNVD